MEAKGKFTSDWRTSEQGRLENPEQQKKPATKR